MPWARPRHGTARSGTPATTQRTSGNDSILGGNAVNAPISAPINVCGNSVAVLGSALSGCQGGATVTSVTTPNHPDLAAMVAGGLAAIGLGVVSLLSIRRRRTARI